MKSGDMDKHFALRSKHGKKRIASLPDQGELALQIKAAILEILGQRGGIADTFLPKTETERTRLNRIAENYDLVLVPSRSGTSKNLPERDVVRKNLVNDDLIARLAVEFSRSIGETPGPQQVSVKNFVNWIFADVAAKGKALRILTANGRELVDDTDESQITLNRGPEWWRDQIGLRRKKLR
jgi:hypothetical protein